MSKLETIVETRDVVVLRVNGTPRSAADGRHKRLVAYVHTGTMSYEAARLLHDAASRIEQTMPVELRP